MVKEGFYFLTNTLESWLKKIRQVGCEKEVVKIKIEKIT